MTTITRKRAAIIGASVLLIAGVSTGGALVTAQSTIFGNTFASEEVTEPLPLIEVDGDAMSAVFSGSTAGESVMKYYTITNKSDATTGKDVTVNLKSLVHTGGNKSDELTNSLTTRISYGGTTYASGMLANMGLAAADLITVPKGTSVTIGLEVFVEDPSGWAPGLGDDATATVDFQFDTIAIPTP